MFEALHVEMIEGGLPAKRAEILKVMADLGERRSRTSVEAKQAAEVATHKHGARVIGADFSSADFSSKVGMETRFALCLPESRPLGSL
jgi:hypothetical protein